MGVFSFRGRILF